MCTFFSFITNGEGKPFYFNHKQRQDMPIEGDPDSHTTLAEWYKPSKPTISGANDDLVNKYEYNLFTKVFTVDQINVKDDRKEAEVFVRALDVNTIVPNFDFDRKFTSPLSMPVKGIELEDFSSLRRYVELQGQFKSQFKGQLWDQLRDQLGCQLRDQLWGQLCSFSTGFVSDFKFKDRGQEELVQIIIELWSRGLVPFYNKNKKEAYLFGNKNAGILFKEKI